MRAQGPRLWMCERKERRVIALSRLMTAGACDGRLSERRALLLRSWPSLFSSLLLLLRLHCLALTLASFSLSPGRPLLFAFSSLPCSCATLRSELSLIPVYETLNALPYDLGPPIVNHLPSNSR